MKTKWSPHLRGWHLVAYEKQEAVIEAHAALLKLLQQHQLKLRLDAGDIYLFSNNRVLHGRDSIIAGADRTLNGHLVPEALMIERHRALMQKANPMFGDSPWFVAMPVERMMSYGAGLAAGSMR